FITLIAIIYPLCTIYNYNSMKFGFRLNSFVLLISEVILLLAFMTNNLLIFYILFESLLIPMALLIGFFGSRARRIYAVYLFLFFTLLSSFFVMLGIAVIYDRCNTLCFINIMEYTFTTYDKNLILFLFFIGFISKIPMVPLHLWLPEAHVEASTIGSVILAAVVLKL